ncbi:Ni/Fe hydrogenase subunit alpha [Candidatus Bipolaricaulota bacterium]
MSSVNINVHHVTRVEGHGNILVNATDGKLEEVLWEVPESPRLFEAMLRGRHYSDVQHISSRICGICSIAHSTASLHASEAALGVPVSGQTQILRRLLFHAEMLESHVLHAYCLAAPDFLGVGSVIPLVDTHRDVVVRAMKLKRLAYHMADLLAGRKTHPISCIVGGFSMLPDLEKLGAVCDALIEALADFEATIDLFKTITVPAFERETEYIALKDPNEYAFISGDIASSDAGLIPIDDYRSVTNEFCVPQSTAKYTKNKREAYQVGALARFNLNHDQLLPRAKEAAVELGLKAPCHNPFMITVAQVVETVHCAEDSIALIGKLLEVGVQEEPEVTEIQAGRGVGAVEAPRGILFHEYAYDADGILTDANCIIPTNQNHNNIQKDMEALVPTILDRSEDEIRLTLEMLVRAYDPCISCSTHLLQVRFTS